MDHRHEYFDRAALVSEAFSHSNMQELIDKVNDGDIYLHEVLDEAQKHLSSNSDTSQNSRDIKEFTYKLLIKLLCTEDYQDRVLWYLEQNKTKLDTTSIILTLMSKFKIEHITTEDIAKAATLIIENNIISVENLLSLASIKSVIWSYPALINLLNRKDPDSFKKGLSECDLQDMFDKFYRSEDTEFPVEGYVSFFTLIDNYGIDLSKNDDSCGALRSNLNSFFGNISSLSDGKVTFMLEKCTTFFIKFIDVINKDRSRQRSFLRDKSYIHSTYCIDPTCNNKFTKYSTNTPLQACLIGGFDELAAKLLSDPEVKCLPLCEQGSETSYSLFGSANITKPLSVYASESGFPKIQALSHKIKALETIEELVNRKDRKNIVQSAVIDEFVRILNEAINKENKQERAYYLQGKSQRLEELRQELQMTSLGASALNAILAVFAYCGCVFLSPFGFKCDSFLFYKNGDKQKAEEALNLVEAFGSNI